MNCLPGCSWTARLIEAGVNRYGGVTSSHALPQLAELLRFIPVRAWFDRTSGLLVHPGSPYDAIDPESIVGVVERCWIDRPFVEAVLHFATEAASIRRALLAMERDRVVRAVGISIAAFSRTAPSLDGVVAIRAVDLVTNPKMERCGLMHRVPCSGWPQRLTTAPPEERLLPCP